MPMAMNRFIKLLLKTQICLILSASSKAESTTEKTEEAFFEIANRICLEKTGYQPLDNNAFFRVVESPVDENVTFNCAYCGEKGEDLPRIWYWKKRELGAEERELEMGLAANLTDNRIFTLPDNSLTIQLVTVNDSGLYYCRSPVEGELSQFHFSLDVIQTEIAVREEKKKEANDEPSFKDYNKKVITKVNEKLGTNVNLAKEFDKVYVKVVSEWDPWLPCDGCLGIRKRYAKCRVRSQLNVAKSNADEKLTDSQKLLLSSPVLSCHSLHLARWFPNLYSLTSSLPNYLRVQPCQDSCVQKNRMFHQAKYKLDFQMDEHSSMTFICPDADLRAKVVWRKDGSIIKPLGPPTTEKPVKKKMFKFFEKKKEYQFRNAFVDRMNVLQLCHVGYTETGVYTCYVDGSPVKSINVTVVTPEETLRERHYHFLLLTFYTCTLSGAIIVIGVTWAILRRHEMFPNTCITGKRRTTLRSKRSYVLMDVKEQVDDDRHY